MGKFSLAFIAIFLSWFVFQTTPLTAWKLAPEEQPKQIKPVTKDQALLQGSQPENSGSRLDYDREMFGGKINSSMILELYQESKKGLAQINLDHWTKQRKLKLVNIVLLQESKLNSSKILYSHTFNVENTEETVTWFNRKLNQAEALNFSFSTPLPTGFDGALQTFLSGFQYDFYIPASDRKEKPFQLEEPSGTYHLSNMTSSDNHSSLTQIALNYFESEEGNLVVERSLSSEAKEVKILITFEDNIHD